MAETPTTAVRVRAPAVLAGELRELILEGDLADGAALPTERELAATSGVSRSSVREALRILEAEGLVVTRPGRNGGPTVRTPTAQTLERPLSMFIRGRGIRMRALIETRLAIEPAVARLAAVNRTGEDLDRLAEINERMHAAATRADRLAANAEWHVALADASRNELLAAIMSTVSQATHAATSLDLFDTPDVEQASELQHDRIRVAIEAQDENAAERRMRRHITGFAEVLNGP